MVSPDILLRRLPRKVQITLVLFGGMLIHMTIGGLDGSYGNIIPYVTSYLKNRSGEDIEYNLMQWIVALIDLGIAVSSLVGGLIEKRFGERATVLIGASIMACGSATSYFAIDKSFWLWLLTYGFINGLGMGIAYNTVMVCAMRWLPNNRGFASGVIQFGYAMGASIFEALQTAFVNPSNDQPQPDGFFNQRGVLNNVPSLFLLIGFVIFLLNVIGCILLMNPVCTPSHHNKKKSTQANASTPLLSVDNGQAKRNYEDGVRREEEEASSPSVSPRLVLSSGTFWCLWFTWICVNQPTNFIISYFKVYGQSFKTNDFLLTALASASAVTAGVSRMLWGCFADRYSYQSAMILITSIMTIFMGSICVTQYAGSWMYFTWVLVIHFALGGPFALCPMAVTAAFGEENAVINNGLFLSSMGVSTVLSAVLTMLLLGLLSFCDMFSLVAAFSFLGLCITVFVHRTKYGGQIGASKKRS